MKNSYFLLYILLLILFPLPKTLSQELDYSGEVNLRAAAASGDRLPFWMYHNQRGRMSAETNLSGWITGRATYTFFKGDTLQAAAGLLYHDGIADKAFIDELYALYQTHWMSAYVGRKQQQELYNGLSSSNRSILRSLNARPLPGFEIKTRRPLFGLSGYGLGFEMSWGEFLLGKNRQVEGARVHHKSFHMVYRTENDWQLKGGLQHYAQWAGESPQRKQPNTFRDYLRVATGLGGGGEASTVSNQASAFANHLMGFEFFLSKIFDDFYLEAFYQHLLEDSSGRLMRNAPDGRYGLFFRTSEKDMLVNSVMYEFYTTHNQSTEYNGLSDNYFNHGFYTSGWTYENRVIGSPFFTADPEGEGIINNQFSMHHLGIGGQYSTYFHTYPYKLLLSYGRNDGTYRRRFRPHQNVFYGLFDMGIFRSWTDLNLQVGAEFDSRKSPIFGVGVSGKVVF